MSRAKKIESSEEDSSSSEEYSSPEEDRDEQYDPTTEAYNPLRALYYPQRALPFLPFPTAPVLNNLSQYSSAIRGKRGGGPGKVSAKVLQAVKTEDMPSTSTGTVRRFLPHQEPIKTEKKAVRNVITRMQEITGPLAVLRDAMERRIRVKVVIKGMAGWAGRDAKRGKGPPKALTTRGELHGSVCAFDRHWNLAMEDVTEVFRRRTPDRQKVLAAAGATMVEWPKEYKKPPKVKVLRKEHRYEVCERYLGQVMVRGEQVAIVAIA